MDDFWAIFDDTELEKLGAYKKTYEKRDIHQEVTDKIIAALSQGTVPWHKPWSTNGIQPTSVDGHEYQATNKLLLGLTQQAKGFGSPHWVTYNRAKQLGGNVRRGEKGTMVIKLGQGKKDEVDPETGEKKPKGYQFLKAYTVFNLDQTEGLDHVRDRLTQKVLRDPINPHEAVQQTIDAYKGGPKVTHALSESCHYSPSDDTITIPHLAQWSDPGRHASGVFHELVHSTGHASRLDRFADTGEPQHFGSERYAKEELVAELGSAMLMGHHNLDWDQEQTPAYISSWLGKLNDDKKLIIPAAAAAQKATNHILGVQSKKAEEEQ